MAPGRLQLVIALLLASALLAQGCHFHGHYHGHANAHVGGSFDPECTDDPEQLTTDATEHNDVSRTAAVAACGELVDRTARREAEERAREEAQRWAKDKMSK